MLPQENLNGLRVLVTRPEPSGLELADLIEKSGGRAIYFPTIAIEKIDSTFCLDPYDIVIFISPQAVYQSISNIKTLPKQIAAIGLGTKEALANVKLSPNFFPKHEWSSEGLLKLTEFANVKGMQIAIVKGEGGRELLHDELKKRGATVTILLAYRRILPKYNVDQYLDLLRKECIDVVISTSYVSLQNLLFLLQDANELLLNVPLLVISERLVQLAQELGFKKVLLAENASHGAILLALRARVLKEGRKIYE